MLDQTTLLIGGHQQLVVARSIRLQRGCGGRDPAIPEVQLPMIKTEPTCLFAMRSYNDDGSEPANNGAITSCPTRSSTLMDSTARTALACGESSRTDGTCALSRESCVTVGRRVEKAAVAASDGEASPEHAANVTGSIATQQAATNRVKNP